MTTLNCGFKANVIAEKTKEQQKKKCLACSIWNFGRRVFPKEQLVWFVIIIK